MAVCSQTGYLLDLPLKSKNQMSLITHELMAFTQVLGHEEVQYYGDNEPTLRQILKLLVAAPSCTMGLKTTRGRRSMTQLAMDWLRMPFNGIRSLATLMESLAEQIEHPIWSWACGHSAWLINKFQPFHGSTSYELAHGRAYESKLCNFGAYCKPKQGFEADPKWGIYLHGEDRTSGQLGDWRCQQSLLVQIFEKDGASNKNLMCYCGFIYSLQLGVSTELWRTHCAIQARGIDGWRANESSTTTKWRGSAR